MKKNKTKIPLISRAKKYIAASANTNILTEIRSFIDSARLQAAQAVNRELVWLNWQIGRRIHLEVLKSKRAAYGENLIEKLGENLTLHYGKGFSSKNLRHMMRFAEVFSNKKIVSALLRQLSWTHFLALIYIDDPLKRNFYAQMCRIERWNTRTLSSKIQSMLIV